MALAKDGRRGFDIKSVLKGCLPEDQQEKDNTASVEEDLKMKAKKEKTTESLKDQRERVDYGSENNAPVSMRDAMEIKLKRKAMEEGDSPVKKMRPDQKRDEHEKEVQDYNGSAFRKVGGTTINADIEDKDSFIRSQWERLHQAGNPGEAKLSLGLPPTLAPPTYLTQGTNLFNPFLGLNMLQQAEMTSMLANKPNLFTEQNLLDAFGRSVAALPTPLTESLANVKSQDQTHEDESSNMHLKNRFPFNQIVNPMVEKLIHKNTSPLLIHSPINAANLSQNWCAKCNASFRMTSDLVYHMRSHHKREFDPVKRKREESYKLKCDVCGEVFKERHHLTRHMTSHL